ncbi:MAG: ABC transporter ATP-binding protein/permease [Bacilli bacterium]|nr:ABC transporter ATP-binding protein/permease [Bacilli bacterium]
MLLGKILSKYYKRYWYLFLIGVLTLLVTDYVQTLIPESLGNIVDLFQSGESDIKEPVLKIVLTVVIVAFGVGIGRAIWRIVLFQASSRIEMGIRDEMFSKSQRLSQSYLHQNPVGNILNWFSTDIEEITDFLGWGTVMLVDAFFMSAIVIVKMYLVNWLVATIIIIPMLLIVAWGVLVERIMSSIWNMRQKSNDELYDFSQENISGLRVIKAFVKEKQQLRAFSKVAQKNREINVKFARISVLFDVSIEVIIGAIFSIALCLGGYLVWRAFGGDPLWGINLKSGELVSLIGYFSSLIWPMIALGQVIAMRSRAKTSLKRITTFIESKEDIYDCEDAVELKDVKGHIEVKDLTFRYSDGNRDVLSHVSFEVKEGETIGVVGKIGSGKSTLSVLFGRVHNVPEGSIFIDGVDIMKATLHSLRSNIAYVPQDNFLFSDEVGNNIGFCKEDATEQEIEEAARFACIDGDIKGFADGYHTLNGERGVSLSGGQKQRISIARAYLKDAPILVMDDSVSAVDVKTEEEILNSIKEKRKGRTTILIASRVSTVSSLDKILVLKRGVVEAFGSHEELLKVSPTYQKMVMLQELEGEAS